MKKTLWFLLASSALVSLLALGLWNVFTGGIGFYPNAILYRGRPCGGYQLYTRPELQLRFGHCFTTSDSAEEVDQWYREREWSKFGEQSLYPSVHLGPFQIAVIRYFLIEEQPNGIVLIVQSVQYLIGIKHF